MIGLAGLRFLYEALTSVRASKFPSGLKWSAMGDTMWLRLAGRGVYSVVDSDLAVWGVTDSPRLDGRR